MALAIDASSPATAVNPTPATKVVTTASFTPPAASLLVLLWSADEQSGGGSTTPTITDNLGAHLTYTLRQWKANGQGLPAVNGQAAIWTAPVTTSAAMTVTVTDNSVGTSGESGLRILVLTNGGVLPTVGTSTKGGQSSGTAVPMAFTATQTGSWGFSAVCDWDATATETAGTGTTKIDSGLAGTGITYGFYRRTSADGTSGVATTLNATLSVASANLAWATVEILGSAATNPAITFAPKRRRVGLPPRKALAQGRVFVPVRAQVNPPWPTLSVRGLRRFILPVRRAELAQVVPAQVIVTAPTIRPTAGRRVRSFLTPVRRADVAQVVPTQAAPVAPAYAPQAPRLRRLSRNRPRAALWWPVAAQDRVPGPTTRRRPQSPTRRPPRAATPVVAQAAAPAPLWVPAVARGLRLVARTVRRAGVGTPVPAQQAAPTNPAITQTVFGRLRLAGRTVRRGQARTPVPAQQVTPNPAITNLAFGRLRSVGRTVRRGSTHMPVPVQQAAPTNPAITQTVFGRLRQVGRVNRRPGTVKPVPTQAAPVAPTWVPGMAARRRPMTRVPVHHSTAPLPATETVKGAVGRRGRGSLLRRGVSRVRAFIAPPAGVIQGPLVIGDSAGTVTANRTSGTVTGGTYTSNDGVGSAQSSAGAVVADSDSDTVTSKYTSQSDSL